LLNTNSQRSRISLAKTFFWPFAKHTEGQKYITTKRFLKSKIVADLFISTISFFDVFLHPAEKESQEL